MIDTAPPGMLQAPTEYSDACSEVKTVHRAVGVMVLSDRGMDIGGADGTSFLHNVSSNDIKSLTAGQGCRTLMLTPKGKIQFSFSVLMRQTGLNIIVEETQLASLKSAIESSLIMEEVTVDDQSGRCQHVHLAGKLLPELMNALALPLPPPPEFSWIEHRGLVVVRRFRTVEEGVDVTMPADQAEQWFEKMKNAAGRLGGGPVGSIAQDILRIESAIPKFGADYTTDHFPQESALEESAVSFTKGCYTGQEVVARIKTYGGVNRRLVGLLIDGPAPCPADKIFLNGTECGRVTSSARSIKFSMAVGLAMLSKDAVSQGTLVHVGSADGMAAVVSDIASRDRWINTCQTR